MSASKQGKPGGATQARKDKQPALKAAQKAAPAQVLSSKQDEPPAPVAPHDFPIVGIGASAGGLAAFEAFFVGMPGDTNPGMAFVLVQHLAPDHKRDRKSTRLNSSHRIASRMPSSA